ncbi:MAG: CCA tRNA nucleotidyltransferase [Rickettsia sp.]|nr:CCA tRNA nucleotidyltransferase [Rickettsia sp.]
MNIHKKLDICSENCLRIINILDQQGSITRIIGGAVRDSLIGIKFYDIDLATSLEPKFVIKFLSKNSIRVIDTGAEFGTVTALIGKEEFQITTLREDITCDGRHAKVKFTTSFQQDAERRDFTINALSYCPKQNIIFDYFNGINDLYEKKVVFIGDANQRIQEDYLRILRFLRFSCKYAEEIDQKSLKSCIENRFGLSKLSKTRLKDEFNVFLDIKSVKMIEILSIAAKQDLLNQIFPGLFNINTDILQKTLDWSQKLNVNICQNSFYALIFFNIKNISLSYLHELSFSKKESRQIISLIEIIMKVMKKNLSQEELKFYMRKSFLQNIKLYYQKLLIILSIEESYIDFLVQEQDFLNSLNAANFTFPITGYDLSNMGFSGKELGMIFNFLKEEWIKSDFRSTKEEILESVTQFQTNNK